MELANVASLNKSAMAASFHGGKSNGFFKSLIEKLTGK